MTNILYFKYIYYWYSLFLKKKKTYNSKNSTIIFAKQNFTVIENISKEKMIFSFWEFFINLIYRKRISNFKYKPST